MNKTLISIFLFCSTWFGFGQMTIAESNAKSAFKEYFALPRETLYLHLNKSNFIIGEEIWFTAYLYNKQKKLPFKETTNVYVGLYDSIGRQIVKKLFRASDGVAHGSIKLDSTIKGGNHYIKASTNWMRNFNGDGAFAQSIKVYDQNTAIDYTFSEKQEFDVQFLPEGGPLISGVQNNIGVKCIDKNGLGVQIVQAIVSDSKHKEVARFKSSPLGMSSFTLKPEHGEQYEVSISFEDGKKENYRLPKSKQQGHNISLVDVDEKKLLIVFGRGEHTKQKNRKQKLVLWVSKDGLAKKLSVDFGKRDDYASLVVDKSEIFGGINIFTLLDNKGKPILERLYYNDYDLSTSDLSVIATKVEKDSIAIRLAMEEKEGSQMNLSISVLPKKTVAYQHQDNILSTFLLKPYVKGFIEKPSYYFQEISPQRKKELDLLLLTQGWSSYDWEAIYSGPIEKDFEFEQGLALVGRVQSKISKGDKLMIYPFDGFQGRIFELKPDKKDFKVAGLYPESDQKIKFSVIGRYGKIKRPQIYINTRSHMGTDLFDEFRYSPIFDNDIQEDSPLPLMEFYRPKNTIELEEVTLTEKKKEQKFATPLIFENKLTKMTKRLSKTYPNILEIIRSHGFYVYKSPTPEINQVFISSRRPISMSSVQEGLSAPPPIIYVDDIRMVDFDRLLYDFPLNRVDSYYIDKSGDMEGGGGGGVIRIYLKDNNQMGANSLSVQAKDKILEYTITHSFEKAKRFYVPKYQAFGQAFEKFGAIHWEPKVIIDKENKASLKILNTGLEEVTLYIEGMGPRGKLISTVKTIKIKEPSTP